MEKASPSTLVRDPLSRPRQPKPFSSNNKPGADDAALTRRQVRDFIDNRFPPLSSFLAMCFGWVVRISAFTIVIPTANGYAESLGASRLFSGLFIGIFPIMSIAAAFMYRHLSDRYSIGFGIQISNVIMMVGSILYALSMLTNSSWTLLVARMIQVGAKREEEQDFLFL